MAVLNNLYPPIIETFMPAFIRTGICRIYFSLSKYNSITDIKNAQVIVNNQNTNISVLNKDYLASVKIVPVRIDNSIKGDYKYYVELAPADIDGGFEINQYYKVQIRFTSVAAPNPPANNSKELTSWLSNNLELFSEWSTVCLIHGIQQPKIQINGFDESLSEDDEVIFAGQGLDFIGRLYYSDNMTLEKEYLQSYQIKVFKNNDLNNIIYDSGMIFTNKYNPNEINYNFKYNFEDGNSYKVYFTYYTNNGYFETKIYNFKILLYGIDALDANISTIVDKEEGRIGVNVKGNYSDIFLGNITIRRTSNESDFTYWEDVCTKYINDGTPLNYTWYDNTVKSGVWYQYCAQKRDSNGNRGSINSNLITSPVMVVFEDAFLTRGDIQLKIKYDPQISSFQRTVSESKVDTIGSKYPFIRRNGNIYYKQFPISGLITHFCDEKELFTNKNELYGDSKSRYEKYNSDNYIDEYQDFILEREFREKVMDFLYEDTVKLFRSTTEGNVLVKLMNISFAPNQILGRMIYSFSATAYEIDEPTIINFDSYGINTIGTYESEVTYTHGKLSQLYGTYSGDLFKIIQNNFNNSLIGFNNVINYLKWVRIEFNSPPYLINTSKNGEVTILQGSGLAPNENTILGYLIYVNGEPVVVDKKGRYELIDEDAEITSINLPVEMNILVDFYCDMNEVEDTSKQASKIYYNRKVGQVWGTFKPNENVIQNLYLKYLINHNDYYQKLVSVDKVNIEAVQGTVIYLKDSFDTDYYRHEVKDTGVLEFYDKNSVIQGMYFRGIHLVEVADYPERKEARDYEFVNTNITASSFDDVTELVKNGVYTINNKKYIYYNSLWYEFTEDNDVLCPVNGLVDYFYEIIKGEY